MASHQFRIIDPLDTLLKLRDFLPRNVCWYVWNYAWSIRETIIPWSPLRKSCLRTLIGIAFENRFQICRHSPWRTWISIQEWSVLFCWGFEPLVKNLFYRAVIPFSFSNSLSKLRWSGKDELLHCPLHFPATIGNLVPDFSSCSKMADHWTWIRKWRLLIPHRAEYNALCELGKSICHTKFWEIIITALPYRTGKDGGLSKKCKICEWLGLPSLPHFISMKRHLKQDCGVKSVTYFFKDISSYSFIWSGGSQLHPGFMRTI